MPETLKKIFAGLPRNLPKAEIVISQASLDAMPKEVQNLLTEPKEKISQYQNLLSDLVYLSKLYPQDIAASELKGAITVVRTKLIKLTKNENPKYAIRLLEKPLNGDQALLLYQEINRLVELYKNILPPEIFILRKKLRQALKNKGVSRNNPNPYK